jgi:hypothetical protein
MAVRNISQHPDGPGTFYPVKHIRVVIDNLGLPMLIPAMQAKIDFFFQGRLFLLSDFIEIYDLSIGIIDNLYFSRFLGEKDSAPSQEGLTIQSVGRDKPQNNPGKLLLASVIGNQCFHKNTPDTD